MARPVIPSAWQTALLALGVYRLWRIPGLDDTPGVNQARTWLTGYKRYSEGTWSYRRPNLAKMLACSWCSGFWLSLVATAVWFVDAHVALLIATPFAVATLVGALGHLLNE